jgi:hypothetical protein
MGMIFTRTGSYDLGYISFIGLSVLTIFIFSLIKKTYDPENGSSKNYAGSSGEESETVPM